MPKINAYKLVEEINTFKESLDTTEGSSYFGNLTWVGYSQKDKTRLYALCNESGKRTMHACNAVQFLAIPELDIVVSFYNFVYSLIPSPPLEANEDTWFVQRRIEYRNENERDDRDYLGAMLLGAQTEWQFDTLAQFSRYIAHNAAHHIPLMVPEWAKFVSRFSRIFESYAAMRLFRSIEAKMSKPGFDLKSDMQMALERLRDSYFSDPDFFSVGVWFVDEPTISDDEVVVAKKHRRDASPHRKSRKSQK